LVNYLVVIEAKLLSFINILPELVEEQREGAYFAATGRAIEWHNPMQNRRQLA
jgi:hypothetical protein